MITIGLPFYNAETTLINAIKSIFQQTYQDWELYLVNDGSTDNSLAIALSVQDPRVKVYSDGLNKGLVHRLNQISQLANGKYMARMDADDIMHPDRLAKQYEYLEANRSVDVLGTAAFSINECNEITGKRGVRNIEITTANVLNNDLIIHPTICGKTEWFRKNPYSQQFIRAEDHELWIRTVRDTTFSHIPEPLYFYRETNKVNMKNYILSCKTDRKIFKTYGPQLVGKAKTNMYIAKSIAKQSIYTLFSTLSIERFLVRSRNQPLTVTEYRETAQILDEICNSSLPTG